MFEEFEKMTNAAAYRRGFHELLMLPDPNRLGTFLGNSQRELFLPFLKKVIGDIDGAAFTNVFDVGAGSGEIVDIALQTLTQATVSIEEPNLLLLEQYKNAVGRHRNLTLGPVYPGTVEDLYRTPLGAEWLDSLPSQNLILAIHMIYHLTPFATDEPISPLKDIEDMLVALYGKLAPEGSIIVVYADQLKSMGGKIGYNHFKQRSPSYAQNLNAIWTARNHLIKTGAISEILDRHFPNDQCEIDTHETPSKFFARTLEELTVLNLSGELGTSDEGPFDVNKLRVAYEYICNHKAELGIANEAADGPRKGMVGGNQPQIICQIKKRKRQPL